MSEEPKLPKNRGIDASIFERVLGRPVDPAIIEAASKKGNNVLSVYLTQLMALKSTGKEVTPEAIVGDKTNATQFRSLLLSLLAQTNPKDEMVLLLVKIPDGDSSLTLLDAALNRGAELLVEQNSWNTTPPKFIVMGVGAEQD
jgi:hypothetical protein